MDNLNLLKTKCKAGIMLLINDHKNNYETVEEFFEKRRLLDEEFEIDSEIEKLMIEKDTVIEIIFYPDTPVGFHSELHYDIDLALKEAMEVFEW